MRQKAEVWLSRAPIPQPQPPTPPPLLMSARTGGGGQSRAVMAQPVHCCSAHV
jgi:hypothetical protein